MTGTPVIGHGAEVRGDGAEILHTPGRTGVLVVDHGLVHVSSRRSCANTHFRKRNGVCLLRREPHRDRARRFVDLEPLRMTARGGARSFGSDGRGRVEQLEDARRTLSQVHRTMPSSRHASLAMARSPSSGRLGQLAVLRLELLEGPLDLAFGVCGADAPVPHQPLRILHEVVRRERRAPGPR